MEPFRRDPYLKALAYHCIGRSTAFIETGTHHGDTLLPVARDFPEKPCISCEATPENWRIAVKRKEDMGLPNARIFPGESTWFVHRLLTKEYNSAQIATWFLDAHGWGHAWPLPTEVELITDACLGGFLIIDDFRNPYRPDYYYETYDGAPCEWESIRAHVKSDNFQLWYPDYGDDPYTAKPGEKFVVGYALLAFGPQDWEWAMPAEFAPKFKRAL